MTLIIKMLVKNTGLDIQLLSSHGFKEFYSCTKKTLLDFMPAAEEGTKIKYL